MKKADTLTKHISKSVAAAGPGKDVAKKSAPTSSKHDHVDVINQLFAELELAYHNQYHKAYAQEGSLNIAKKYWLQCLAPFSPEVILAAVRDVVTSQEYLPSIATIVNACNAAMTRYGLPAAHDAYVEACCAPNPKALQAWTHPAVYLAGKQTGWYDLAHKSEMQVYPLFERHYKALCQRALKGEELTYEIPPALPDPEAKQLSPEENHKRMTALRKSLIKG